jgi:hypothetical protein
MNLYALVPELLDLMPGADEFQLRDLLEERSGTTLNGEDLQTIRALCLRVWLRQAADTPHPAGDLAAESAPGYLETIKAG